MWHYKRTYGRTNGWPDGQRYYNIPAFSSKSARIMELCYSKISQICTYIDYMGRAMRKRVFGYMRTVNAQIRPSYICARQRFRSACAYAQSDQTLHWAHYAEFLQRNNKDWSDCANAQADCDFVKSMSEGRFSHVAAHADTGYIVTVKFHELAHLQCVCVCACACVTCK